MMTYPCKVTADLRDYDRQQDIADARGPMIDDAIEQRTAELLSSDFCPWSQENILEAIEEIDLVGKNGVTIAEIARCMNHANWERLGQIIGEGVLGYWDFLARKRAEEEIGRAIAWGEFE